LNKFSEQIIQFFLQTQNLILLRKIVLRKNLAEHKDPKKLVNSPFQGLLYMQLCGLLFLIAFFLYAGFAVNLDI